VQVPFVVVAIFAPPLVAVLAALAQLGIYQLLARCGAIKRDGVPIFPVLLFRGFLVALALVLAGTLWSSRDYHPAEDPHLSDEVRQFYRDARDGPQPDTPAP